MNTGLPPQAELIGARSPNARSIAHCGLEGAPMSHRSTAPPGLGLVLGAGGVVGMTYHAGVLHALVEEGGLDAGRRRPRGRHQRRAASLVRCLRTGWTTADCWSFAMGTHPAGGRRSTRSSGSAGRRRCSRPAFTSPSDSPASPWARPTSWPVRVARGPFLTLPPALARYLRPTLPRRAVQHGRHPRCAWPTVLPETWPDQRAVAGGPRHRRPVGGWCSDGAGSPERRPARRRAGLLRHPGRLPARCGPAG